MHKEVPSPSAVLNKSVSLIEYVHARHEHRTGVYSTLQNSARKNSSGHAAFLGCMALPQNDSDECKADMENLKLRLDTLNREVKRIEAQLKQGESLSKCIMVEDSADQRLLSLLHTHMHMTPAATLASVSNGNHCPVLHAYGMFHTGSHRTRTRSYPCLAHTCIAVVSHLTSANGIHNWQPQLLVPPSGASALSSVIASTTQAALRCIRLRLYEPDEATWALENGHLDADWEGPPIDSLKNPMLYRVTVKDVRVVMCVVRAASHCRRYLVFVVTAMASDMFARRFLGVGVC
jgi:hypothetical protein